MQLVYLTSQSSKPVNYVCKAFQSVCNSENICSIFTIIEWFLSISLRNLNISDRNCMAYIKTVCQGFSYFVKFILVIHIYIMFPFTIIKILFLKITKQCFYIFLVPISIILSPTHQLFQTNFTPLKSYAFPTNSQFLENNFISSFTESTESVCSSQNTVLNCCNRDSKTQLKSDKCPFSPGITCKGRQANNLGTAKEDSQIPNGQVGSCPHTMKTCGFHLCI